MTMTKTKGFWRASSVRLHNRCLSKFSLSDLFASIRVIRGPTFLLTKDFFDSLKQQAISTRI
jgi:hypothetical protein